MHNVDIHKCLYYPQQGVESRCIMLIHKCLYYPQQGVDAEFALVVAGTTLRFALEEHLKLPFLDLALQCGAVICCRVTPLQKVGCPLKRCNHWISGNFCLMQSIIK